MEFALTREDSRATDAYTIDEIGIPGMVLMENAGRTIFQTVMEILNIRGGLTVYTLAGKGNNGGDGFVVARYLLEQQVDVRVFHVGSEDEYSGDAATNFQILQRLSGNIYHTPAVAALTELTDEMLPADVVVDGLLGTGIEGAPRSPYDEFIEWINSYNAPTVAIDIPSGVDANTGQTPGAAVSAEATVTMGFVKTGLLFSPGREYAGEVTVADISVPHSALDDAENVYFLPREDDIHYRLPIRQPDVYKHKAGKVFTLCGARGFTGAAAMVSEAALVSGAGLVLAGVPESLNPAMEAKLTEVITVPLPETEHGAYTAAAFEEVESYFDWSDTLAIGSGMTRQEEPQQLVATVLENYKKVAVVDADAATYFSGENLDRLRQCPGELILTPHWGEFFRMSGAGVSDLTGDRLNIAQHFAREHQVTLVLKGAPTIIAGETGKVFINTTGNAGMASAGTGDVLTGMIAGFAAQGLSPIDAALVGVYLHGLAGDFARDELTELGLTATTLITHLPRAVKYIQEYYENL